MPCPRVQHVRTAPRRVAGRKRIDQRRAAETAAVTYNPFVDAAFVATSRGLNEAAQGRTEQASFFASEAVRNVSERTSRRTLRRLGRLLVSLGRLPDALPVWERLVVRGVVDDDVRSFVECAARLERHGRVMEVCASARAAGIFDGFLLRSELRLLDRYDPEAALSLLEDIVRRPETDKSARVHLVHLAIRLGRKALAESHIGALPTAAEADPEEGATVASALGALGRTDEAQAYAYDILRRHFQDHHAHRAFRDAVMLRDRSGESDELEVPELAGPGVAVCLAEEGNAPPQWFVLEDSSVHATGVEGEIRPESSLGRRLAGKKIGDVVALSEGPGVTRTATVRELLPKYVFRVRDVMDRWQYRFPDHQEIWMVRLPTSGPEQKPDFSSLIELAKDGYRRQKDAEALYSEKAIPVWLFGRALGKAEIFAVAHIAGTDGLVLRCCAGSADEYVEASRSLKAASEVVIDVTAVRTLLLLEQLGVLDALGKAVILTHSTMNAIRAFVEKARSHTQASSSAGQKFGQIPRFTIAERHDQLRGVGAPSARRAPDGAACALGRRAGEGGGGHAPCDGRATDRTSGDGPTDDGGRGAGDGHRPRGGGAHSHGAGVASAL